MTYVVNITDEAKADMRETLTYIRDTLKSRGAAAKLETAIMDALARLATMPTLHPVVPLGIPDVAVRRMTIKNYNAYFHVEQEAGIVWVDAVLYCRRDWERVLLDRL